MKKLISAILAMAMVFVMSIPVFATNNQSSSEDFTLAEAAEILGVAEEDLAGMKIQQLSSLSQNTNSRTNSTPIPSILESGNVYYEDITTSTFTGALHRINGTKFMWAAKLTTLNTNHSINFLIQRWDTDDASFWQDSCSLHDEGDQYNSGWCNEAYGQEFYFKYYLNNGSSEDNNRVRIVVAVY